MLASVYQCVYNPLAARLEWVVLGRNLLDKVTANDRNLLHNVLAQPRNVFEEEECEHACDASEASSRNGTVWSVFVPLSYDSRLQSRCAGHVNSVKVRGDLVAVQTFSSCTPSTMNESILWSVLALKFPLIVWHLCPWLQSIDAIELLTILCLNMSAQARLII